MPPMLVVGGTYMGTIGTQVVNNIAAWDGTSWHAFGSGLDGIPLDITTIDPDGDGPLPAQLVVAGQFDHAGGALVNHVARWDGSAWYPLGNGTPGGIGKLLGWWDPDGGGPLPARLVAVGGFSSGLAAWDGAAWQPIDTGVHDSIMTAVLWDPDGNGPLPSQIVAAFYAFPAPLWYVARWNGTAWEQLGTAMSGRIYSLCAWDPDGAAPAAPRLIAGGEFTVSNTVVNGIAQWNGSEWQPLDGGIQGRWANDNVRSLFCADLEGLGNGAQQLIVGGLFDRAGGRVTGPIARWDGEAWHPFGTGLAGVDGAQVTAQCTDPSTSHLVAGGTFEQADGVQLNGVASWDGQSWSPLGLGIGPPPAVVLSLAAFDQDGTGPAPANVVAAGEFSEAGGTPANNIASWDGDHWQAMGEGVHGTVSALAVWNATQAGSTASTLVVAGTFDTAGGQPAANVAAWDGIAWHSLGPGLNGAVNAAVTWDPDGPGPAAPQVVVGGEFDHAGPTSAGHIAGWDGSSWHEVGGGLNGTVNALTVWDPDGNGPLFPQLVAAGNFTSTVSGGEVLNGIARWDGASWHAFSTGFEGAGPSGLGTWDLDGVGPLPPVLFACRDELIVSGAMEITSLVRWTGSSWEAFGGTGDYGVGPNTWTISTWDPDGPGPLPARLVLGGLFQQAGTVTSSCVAIYGCTMPQCAADVDDGTSTGTRDGAVTIEDLLYFLGAYSAGATAADLDDGSGTGIPDGAVTIDDLLYFLTHYAGGC